MARTCKKSRILDTRKKAFDEAEKLMSESERKAVKRPGSSNSHKAA